MHMKKLVVAAAVAMMTSGGAVAEKSAPDFSAFANMGGSYRISESGDIFLYPAPQGMSDAGEPSGTAGRPMLDVLLGSGVGDVAAVVTRYYGGVKLGRGGLVRAYGGAVKFALDGLPLTERVELTELAVEIGYPAVSPLKNALGRFEAVVVDEDYGTRVSLRIRLPEEHARAFRETIAALTDGAGRVEDG